MILHRINIGIKYCTSELIIIILFIIPNFCGILSFLLLIYLRFKIFSESVYTTGLTLSKIKLILLYIFGIGYMFHSGLYAWKHNDFQDDCPENSNVDLTYNILSISYTFIVFVYFALFHDRKLEQAAKKYYVLIPIIVANVCIWLNAILFGSDFLYENVTAIANASAMINTTESSNIAVEAIEKADTFCLPAMVEFSLLAIEMLFEETDNTINGYLNRNSQNIQELDTSEKICDIVKKFIQIVVSFAALVHFAFVFTIVLTTNSSNNILEHSHYFQVYFCFELVMKLTMLILIFLLFFICACNSGSCKQCLKKIPKLGSALPKPSLVVLVFTTVCNIVYHILYCIALSKYTAISSVSSGISLFVNILSLFLAPLQTLMILLIRSKNLTRTSQVIQPLQCCQTTFYYSCFILGVLNLALWASDSIGEDRRSMLSIVYQWSSVLYTIFFPITIFFRFQTGMYFLEFYWRNSKF